MTQETWLDGLIKKYNTKEQAKFYIEHSGGSFDEYIRQHRAYYQSLKRLKQQIPLKLRYQEVDKEFLPSFIFGPNDLVIVLGRDGLVINTAKYLSDQPILGVNPDPDRIDGILLQFQVDEIEAQISKILNDNAEIREISLVKARLNNGQEIIGVNDLFVGHKSHGSARYTIKVDGRSERQSSSGVIFSTGIGSTGWMKSIIATSMKIASHFTDISNDPDTPHNFDWDADYLVYAVREAWKSTFTSNDQVFGYLQEGKTVEIESHMTDGGVIFSDGMQTDCIDFNSGRVVLISLADRKVKYYKNSR